MTNMQLQDRHIDEFISLYEKHFGVVLERPIALEKGLKLCRLVELAVFEPKEKESNRSLNVYK